MLEGGKYSNYYFGKELGAALVALEHRYYGESYPTEDQLKNDENNDMKYLSSR